MLFSNAYYSLVRFFFLIKEIEKGSIRISQIIVPLYLEAMTEDSPSFHGDGYCTGNF